MRSAPRTGRERRRPWVLPAAAARRAALAVGIALAAAAPLAAQQPTPVRADTVRRTPRPDTAVRPAVSDTSKPKTTRELLLDKLQLLERRDTTPDSVRVRQDSAAAAAAQQARATPALPAAPGGGGGNTPQPIARDSIMDELLKIPGYSAAVYSGSEARYRADSARLVLKGPAQVAQGTQAMAADSMLVYNLDTSVACGYGKPVLTGAGQSAPVQSEQVCYDVNRKIGLARGARTQFSEQGTWYVHGDVYPVGDQLLYGKNAEFTDCNLEVPHYHFTAHEVKIIKNDVLVARNVTLSFADVPVFWLPFMMQSTKQGRRSGLLMPRFDINDIARTRQSYNRRLSNLGFYWAISDHLGSELAVDWFSNNYTALRGSFDYKWLRQFLDGSITLQRYWKQEGGSELTVNASNSWQPDERTQVRVDGTYASSSQFVQQQSFDPTELNRDITSNAGLNRRFDWGSVNLQLSRRQSVTQDKVDWTLPSVGLNLSPVTLFAAPGLHNSWYNNMTLTGNASARWSKTDNSNFAAHPGAQDARALSASANTSLRVGSFSLSQTANLDKSTRLSRPLYDSVGVELPDTALAGQLQDRLTWSTSINYQQQLIGSTTLTPQLALQGQAVRNDVSHGQLVSAPLRLNFGAGLATSVYGFWPGFGPFSRIRHRVSPTLSYNYSPAPSPGSISPLQDSVFGASGLSIRQVNAISIGISQSIEAKFKEKAKEAGDTLAPDTVAQDTADLGTPGEPRHLEQSRKMKLLELTTSAVAYNFVTDTLASQRLGRRVPFGFFDGNTTLTNTVRSDLLPGLSLSLGQDLFRSDTTAPHGKIFDPHLSNVSMSFSLDGNSWLFRTLGLGPAKDVKKPVQQAATPADTSAQAISAQQGLSIVGQSSAQADQLGLAQRSGPIGGWRASLNYSMLRPREGGVGTQTLQANLTLQPTEHWNVTWRTGYSFSDHGFLDHVLTLTRDLHEWEAHFDFVKAQNGNFSFQFRVNLRANPDLKFDYRDLGGNSYRRGLPPS